MSRRRGHGVQFARPVFAVGGTVSGYASMGSSESLAGLGKDPEEGDGVKVLKEKETKVFKSAFAKELEEKSVPKVGQKEAEERRKEEKRRRRSEERRAASEEGLEAERQYSRLREENSSLRLEIMKIQLEDKRYRDLQQEVDLLSKQLQKMEESRGVYEAATQQLGSFLDLVSAQMLEPQDRSTITSPLLPGTLGGRRVGRSMSLAALSSSTASSSISQGRRRRRVQEGSRGLPSKGRSKSSAAESRRPLEKEEKEEEGRTASLQESKAEKEEEEEGQERRRGKRGGRALKRIKTFLRREKKYVVEDCGSNSPKLCNENFSEPTSAKIVGFHGIWSLRNS